MSVTSITMDPTEVLLEDFKDLLTCCCCHEAPMLPPVATCRLGHCVCANCREKRKVCNVCEEPLTGRNLPLEKTLMILLQCIPKDLIVYEIKEEENKLEKEELCAAKAYRKACKEMSKAIDENTKTHIITSGRTFPCPFPCNVNITGPGLYRHFGFQHPEVFIGAMSKNRPFSICIPRELIFQLNEQSPTRCVYFLVVSVGDQECKEEDNPVDIRSVRAADLLSMSHTLSYMLNRRTYFALLSVHRLSDPEVYALWVTALYHFSPVTYTLSYNNGFDSVSYQGRPASIFAPAPPLQKGGCLMLTSSLVERDFKLHPNYLELTLFFHLDLPFPRVLPDVTSKTKSSAPELIDQ